MYNLPTTVNPNKIFLIKRSDLEERYDSEFYKPVYNNILSKHKKWNRCKDISISIQHPPEYERIYSDDGMQLIRSQNVRPSGLSLNENPVFFSPDFLKGKKIVLPTIGDVLIVRSGVNAGDVATVENNIYNAIIGADNLLLKPNNKIIPKFIQVYFSTSIGRVLMNRYITGATNTHISPYYLSRVQIPDLSKEDQQICVELYNESLKAKQQKEAEAKALLESIDTYLLGELGISLPEQDNSLKKRIFTKRYSELAGERLDSIFYASDLMRFYSGKYPSVSLKSASISFKSGIGAGKQDQAIDQNGIIQIRPTNIDENGLLKFDRNIYLPFEAKADTLDVDDVLFNNTNSQELVGKTAILKEQKELCYSNHITRIKVDQNKLVPDFLWVILNVYQKNKVFYSICTNWNNQSGIGLELLKSLKIPLPPLEKQSEIANHIQNIHSQAKALQHEAAMVLEEAKREVEKMILGE